MKLTTFAQANKALEAYWPSNQAALYKHTLEHIQRFMEFLDNPQDKLRVIHVAGTSGKTSTAYYTAALLHAAGKSVGLTVSPHVDQINERVQVNLRPLAEKTFCQELSEFLELVQRSAVQLNYFEVMYTFAIWQFARRRLDYAVVEVGIGGLLDSTNVITRADKICVITDIGFDHMNILGNTLTEIAMHKAGIIHLRNSVFCYRQNEVVMDAITKAAKQHQADLHILDVSEEATEFTFLPLFQQRNLGLARATAAWALQRDYNGQKLSDAAVKLAAHTHIPGRMETLRRRGKTIIIDAAHNPQKLQALQESVHSLHPDQPIAALVSLLSGRDYRLEDSSAEMAKLGDHLIVTGFAGPQDGPHQSVEPHALAAACRQHGAKSVEVITDPGEAFRALLARPEALAVVAGSFYLLNHIRPLLHTK